jgi:hypothetical protein
MTPRSSSFADELLDELLPGDLDWPELVRRYPRLCLLAAGAAGTWLGYHRGRAVIAALGALVAGRMAGSLGDILGGE